MLRITIVLLQPFAMYVLAKTMLDTCQKNKETAPYFYACKKRKQKSVDNINVTIFQLMSEIDKML